MIEDADYEEVIIPRWKSRVLRFLNRKRLQKVFIPGTDTHPTMKMELFVNKKGTITITDVREV